MWRGYFFIALPLCVNCKAQKLLTKALFYNEKGKLFKFEERYEVRKDSSYLYYAHYSDMSVGAIRTHSTKKDTLVITEEYFIVKRKKSRIESYSEDFSPLTMIWADGDSVKMTFYARDYTASGELSSTGNVIGDTLLAGKEIAQFDSLIEKYRDDKVKLILNNTIEVYKDSLQFLERSVAYYINKIPVKLEVYNPDPDSPGREYLYLRMYFTTTKGKFVPGREISDGAEIFTIFCDSITWNKDQSRIMIYDTYSIQPHQVSYIRLKNRTVVYNDDPVEKTFQYLEDPPSLAQIILGYTVYFDLPVNISLLWIDEAQIKKIAGPDGIYENAYTFKDHKITSITKSKNKRVYETVHLFHVN